VVYEKFSEVEDCVRYRGVGSDKFCHRPKREWKKNKGSGVFMPNSTPLREREIAEARMKEVKHGHA